MRNKYGKRQGVSDHKFRESLKLFYSDIEGIEATNLSNVNKTCFFQ
jgi:hypothetical protein